MPDNDKHWQLYPLPEALQSLELEAAEEIDFNELYARLLETQCGATDDSQAVAQYDGTLGVTKEFVAAHQSMVGQVQWNNNLAGIYTNAGNVSGVRWGTGTLVADNLFLTAGHLFDQAPGSGWMVPLVNGTTNPLTPQQIAQNMHVNFNYQVDANGNLLPEQQFAITELIEYRWGGVDYAIVRLAGSPRPSYGVGRVATGDPSTGDTICIIGHPNGVPKRIEAGRISEYSGNQLRYNDVDTLGGNSGSPIWHSPSGTIVGVHTNGGCTSTGGYNFAMRISSILRVSPTVQSLTLDAAPIVAEHSLKVVDVSEESRATGANIYQWHYSGGSNQRFRPEFLDDGHCRFVADHSGKVMDVSEISQDNGARLHQWDWLGGANQRFKLEGVGRGYCRMVAKHSGKVVDVAEISRESGAQIHQWDWLNGANQRFRILAGPVFVQHTGKVFDIAGSSTADGAPLIQRDYYGDANQIFRLEPLGDGFYRIIADQSGKVLDVENASAANGARIIQWPWHGGRNQRFRLDAVGGGFFRIVAEHSGKVLDVAGISGASGAQIQQWDWWNGPNQRFRLFSTPLIAVHSGKALDVAAISTDNGAEIVQWDFWGGLNQRFYPERLEDGTYRFVADHSGKVIDVEDYSQANGARIHQWDWHGGPNQRFRLEPVLSPLAPIPTGEYRIVAVHSGKVLDVSGISNANGAAVVQWDWVNGPNQRWRFR
jgi:V8-like Glu-specific endopeptidase